MKRIHGVGLLLLVMVICTYNTNSQINLNVKVSASNYLRYGTGKENSVAGDNSKKYFEELADVRLFVNDFLFGARYEYDDPIEFHMVTGTGGESINVGLNNTVIKNYGLASNWNEDECHLTVFIQSTSTKQIFGVERIKIKP